MQAGGWESSVKEIAYYWMAQPKDMRGVDPELMCSSGVRVEGNINRTVLS